MAPAENPVPFSFSAVAANSCMVVGTVSPSCAKIFVLYQRTVLP